MDLKCFGGAKCPDWVISGLFACGKFDAQNANSFCMAIAAHAAGETLDEEEIKTVLKRYNMDTVDDTKQILGSILYVLKTTARWDSDSAQLAAGMRSIRISNHMIRALRAAFDEYGREIASVMRRSAFRFTKLLDASTSSPPDAAIDCVQLNLRVEDCIKKSTNDHNILIQRDDLGELISELKKIKNTLDSK